MNDQQMLRYARHIMLDDFGFEGQETLSQSRVLILGLGGLGSPALAYLAAAGVGHLDLLDYDTVELSNLQRQIAHTTARVGETKVASAAQFVQQLNPDVQVRQHAYKADDQQLAALIAQTDVVLDCSDNFSVRQQLNRLCFAAKVPLVSAAAIKYNAQITVFDFRKGQGPCYACLYDPQEPIAPDNCATLGVFAPLLGIIGSMQAAEALKLLLNLGQSLQGRLLMLDILPMRWHSLTLQAQPTCPVCSHHQGHIKDH
ncbi:HesA/MoeB/ThiF family protein [Brackiella oedipodis]|uniref:HesA/MoeB/ThiF family protein n=1 Tax=Brackiella oedipodis TaxID=124225 RepID=UPI000491B6A8|nr:molybdopterin-synthase adenylyltransferase MoeB [Brackiella oedipodis]